MRELGKNNPLVTRLRKLKDKEERYAQGLYLCEGHKLLGEALTRGARVRYVLALEGERLPTLPDYTEVYTVSESLMAGLSPVKTPQGVLAVCVIPQEKTALEGRCHIVLDGLQDPGNVGTILRTADAFGVDGVVLTEDCADPYNPKCVRASMGAVFKNNFIFCPRQEIPALFAGRTLYAADMNGNVTAGKSNLSDCAVIIGTEGSGVSEFLKKAATGILSIPMEPGAESLNAAMAATVIMWEMYRGKE